MELKARLRSAIKAGRRRGALWVRLLDFGRTVATARGRSILWTRIVHGGEVHQTTAYTCEDRYPELFDLAAELAPGAKRILSFGCSTGEELSALRRRFPGAEIVGAEINPRSRRIAARRMAEDERTEVIDPGSLTGGFDVVFALAVLQRQPDMISEMRVEDLSAHYPFRRFDEAVELLVGTLRSGGLLCVMNTQYRIEDSSAAPSLQPVPASPLMDHPLFAPGGRRLAGAKAHTMFRRSSAG